MEKRIEEAAKILANAHVKTMKENGWIDIPQYLYEDIVVEFDDEIKTLSKNLRMALLNTLESDKRSSETVRVVARVE